MGFLTGLLPASLKEWLRILVVALLVAGITYPLARCSGEKSERARQTLLLEKANRLYLEQKARADTLAANQRLTDLIAVQQRERDLRDAIASTPDSAPDAVRIQLGCQRLRAAGRDTSGIPACSRPAGGTQAGPTG